jgi:hypothetical protein
MEAPEIHVLNQIGWQFFGSLTFKQERLPERVRLSMFFALIRKAARDVRVPFKKLLWCLRQERGEATARRHFHFLLAGLPVEAVSLRTCFSLKNAWEQLKGGMARVTVFDPALDGGSYLLKPDSHSASPVDAGDTYESTKFGGGFCNLMIAQSVWRLATARRLLQLTR